MRIGFMLILPFAACVFAAPVSAGSAAGAQPPPGNGSRLSSKGISGLNKLEFNIIDADKDGFLSEEELKARGLVVLKALDANKDGMMDKAEFKAVPSTLLFKLGPCCQAIGECSPDRTFEALDVNGDGKIDRAEFKAAFAVAFKTLDADDDGRISLAEYLVLRIDRREANAKLK